MDARLPAGRRGSDALTPAQVAEHQRTRMLVAMVGAVADAGYTAATVADVVTRAGVSRATFYEQFADKRACFVAACAASTQALTAAMGDDAGDTTLDELLARYLDAVADNPDYARVFTVEITALGGEGVLLRAGQLERYTSAIARVVGVSDEPGLFACRALVSAIAMMVSSLLAAGDVAGIRALHGPLLELAGSLFGHETAGGGVGGGV